MPQRLSGTAEIRGVDLVALSHSLDGYIRMEWQVYRSVLALRRREGPVLNRGEWSERRLTIEIRAHRLTLRALTTIRREGLRHQVRLVIVPVVPYQLGFDDLTGSLSTPALPLEAGSQVGLAG